MAVALKLARPHYYRLSAYERKLNDFMRGLQTSGQPCAWAATGRAVTTTPARGTISLGRCGAKRRASATRGSASPASRSSSPCLGKGNDQLKTVIWPDAPPEAGSSPKPSNQDRPPFFRKLHALDPQQHVARS
jgi:hypothetical protein